MNIRIIKILNIILLIFLLTTCKKPEPETTGKITGIIKDISNNATLIADVSLSPDNTILTTGSDGKYEFSELDPSKSYTISVNCNSYKSETKQNIKVIAGQSTILDISLTKLNPTIVITTPASGTNWQTNANQTIKWTSSDLTGNVKIELVKGTSVLKTIETSTENDGEYIWTIPNDITNGTDYKIKITSLNNSTIFDESDFFTILVVLAPYAVTELATNLTTSSARLNAIVNPNGQTTNVIFEYGITTSYGQTINAFQNSVSGTSNLNIYADLAGLQPNTTYNYRVKATSSAGITNGENMTFKTQNYPPPTATTSDATIITQTTATLNGTVNANGFSTTVSFEYGTTTSYGQTKTANQSPITGNLNESVSCSLSGLTANTIYHFRVKAESVYRAIGFKL